MSAFDLAAYLDRIGWTGSALPPPTLETLAALLLAHTARIPFENVDVLLGRGVRLDLEGLQDKIVRRKRGGYCFEHATLLAGALGTLGFRFERHSARVIMVSPRTEAPRTHMFLTVTLPEGTFVADPGFGGYAPRVPVPLVHGREVSFEEQTHAMVREGDAWILRFKGETGMTDGWITELSNDNLVDFEVANHWTATHPSSPFKKLLLARAITPEGRVTVMNREVTIYEKDAAEKSELADRRALRALFARHFGFDLPEVETMKVPAIEGWS